MTIAAPNGSRDPSEDLDAQREVRATLVELGLIGAVRTPESAHRIILRLARKLIDTRAELEKLKQESAP